MSGVCNSDHSHISAMLSKQAPLFIDCVTFFAACYLQVMRCQQDTWFDFVLLATMPFVALFGACHLQMKSSQDLWFSLVLLAADLVTLFAACCLSAESERYAIQSCAACYTVFSQFAACHLYMWFNITLLVAKKLFVTLFAACHLQMMESARLVVQSRVV